MNIWEGDRAKRNTWKEREETVIVSYWVTFNQSFASSFILSYGM